MILQRVARILLISALVAIVMLGYRWYNYVTNTNTPYDEVGIELNLYMPKPVRKWGCDRLHQTFGNVLPPYGCAAEGGGWI